MHHGDKTRPGETELDAALPQGASLQIIGTIRTPFATRDDCPKRGDPENGPLCQLQIDPRLAPALEGIDALEALDVVYWLHAARRDLLTQSRGGARRGTFSLRSPLRPNPIGLSPVRLLRREGTVLYVRRLDCLDGTPLLDIKPLRCQWSPAGDT